MTAIHDRQPVGYVVYLKSTHTLDQTTLQIGTNNLLDHEKKKTKTGYFCCMNISRNKMDGCDVMRVAVRAFIS